MSSKKIFSHFNRFTKNQKIFLLTFCLLILTSFVLLCGKYDIVSLASKSVRQLFEAKEVYNDDTFVITKAIIYSEKGEELKNFEQQDVNDTTIKLAKVYLEYNAKTEGLYDGDKWVGKVVYNLPKAIKGLASEAEGYIYSNEEIVGTFIANPDNIELNFDEEKLSQGLTIYGNISFYAEIDFGELKYSDNLTLEFSDKVQYDIFVKLKEELNLHKKALEPKIDEANNTITFGYEVTIFSPSSTNGREINIKDILTKTKSSDENITRSSIKVEWKDSKGNKKTIPKDNKLEIKDKKTIEGTLPPLEVGDEIKFTYDVVEHLSSWSNETFDEANKATAKIYDKDKELISLEVEAKSMAVKFKGSDYYDIDVQKEYIDKDFNNEGNIYTYPFEVKISASEGTKGNEIKVSDEFTIKNTNLKQVNIVDLLIFKVSGNQKEEITSSNYLKIVNKLEGTDAKNINTYKVLEGNLPALDVGEYYLIDYKIKVEYTNSSPNPLNNTVTADSSKASAQATATGASDDIDVSIGLDNASCSSHLCGASEYTYDYTLIVTANENNEIIRDFYEIYVEMANLSSNNKFQLELYDYKTGKVYEHQEITFPIKFKKEQDGFYLITANDKKIKMNSSRDKIVASQKTYSRIVYDYSTDLYRVSLKKNGVIIDDKTHEVRVGYPVCSSSCYTPPYIPQCGAKNLENKFVGASEVEDNKIKLKWEATILKGNDGYYSGLYELELNRYYGTNDHYYTKDQIDNIKFYYIDSNKQKQILDKKYYYINSFYVTHLTIELKHDVQGLNAEKIIIESESTASIPDGYLVGKFTSYFNNYTCKSNEASAEYIYKKEKGPADDVLTKYNYLSNDTFNNMNTVTYNNDETYFYYRVAINYDGSLSGDAIYTDTLPEGTELVQEPWSFGKKKCQAGSNSCKDGLLIQYANLNSRNDGSYSGTNYLNKPFDVIEYTYDPATRKITLNIPESAYDFSNKNTPSYQQIVLYYKVKYVGKLSKDTYLKNKATLKSTNSDKTSEADTSILTSKFAKSKGEFNEKDSTVTYYVKINDQAQQMFDGTTIDVIDKLSYDNKSSTISDVTVESVKLYELVNGEKGKLIGKADYSSNKVNNGLELRIKIPDSKALYLEYTYKFTFINDAPTKVELSNSISIVGESEAWAKHQQETVIYKKGVEVNAYSDFTSLDLVKSDLNDESKLLANAVYSLERYDGNKWLDLGKFTTDSDGKVALGEKNRSNNLVMYYNCVYRLKELKSPSGYELDKSYYYVYLYNDKIIQEKIPEEIDLDKVINKGLDYAKVTDTKITKLPNTGDNITKVMIAFVVSILCLIVLAFKRKSVLKNGKYVEV